MISTRRAATRLAVAWLRGKGLGRFAQVRLERHGNHFRASVQGTIPGIGFKHLASIKILRSGRIRVHTDLIDEIVPESVWRGLDTEHRVLEALDNDRPEWLLRVKLSSPQFDRRGIDAIATVRLVGKGAQLRLPLQIKSSYEGRSDYMHAFPDLARHVAVIVARPKDDAATIRRVALGLIERKARYFMEHREELSVFWKWLKAAR